MADELTDLSSLSGELADKLQSALDGASEPEPKPADDPAKIDVVNTDKKDDAKPKAEDGKSDDDADGELKLDIDNPDPDKKDDKGDGTTDDKKDDKPTGESLDVIDYGSALKEAGFEYKDPITNHTEFATALKTISEGIKKSTRDELFTELADLNGYSPEAQFAIRQVQLGVPSDEIAKPGSAYDKMIAMDDEQLVLAALVDGQKMEPAAAKEKLEDMKEDEVLAQEATAIRRDLNAAKQNYLTQYNEKKKQYVEGRMNELKQKAIQFDNDVVAEINATANLYGVEITPQLRKQLADKYKSSTEYRTRLTADPKYVARLILQSELSERAVETIRKRSASAAKREAKKEEHKKNYKPNNGTNETGTHSSHATQDAFDKWNAIKEQVAIPAHSS